MTVVKYGDIFETDSLLGYDTLDAMLPAIHDDQELDRLPEEDVPTYMTSDYKTDSQNLGLRILEAGELLFYNTLNEMLPVRYQDGLDEIPPGGDLPEEYVPDYKTALLNLGLKIIETEG